MALVTTKSLHLADFQWQSHSKSNTYLLPLLDGTLIPFFSTLDQPLSYLEYLLYYEGCKDLSFSASTVKEAQSEEGGRKLRPGYCAACKSDVICSLRLAVSENVWAYPISEWQKCVVKQSSNKLEGRESITFLTFFTESSTLLGIRSANSFLLQNAPVRLGCCPVTEEET